MTSSAAIHLPGLIQKLSTPVTMVVTRDVYLRRNRPLADAFRACG
jgi:hypothetical protein